MASKSKTTYMKTLGDWEGLLGAVAEHIQLMPEVEDLRKVLDQHAARARELKLQQESATALRQGLTQQIKAELVKGRDVALRIRGIARARIGPKNESLVQFNVAPLRPRTRRAAPVELPGPIPAPAPAPSVAQPQQKGGDPPVH
jgi:hypothetical protein